MGKLELTLPAMGEGIIEATITKWFVKEGDTVDEDDSLLEVATDKVDSEIPAPCSGKIGQIIYHEGEIPKIGEVLAIIESDSVQEEETGEPAPAEFVKEAAAAEKAEVKAEIPRKQTRPASVKRIDGADGNDLHLTPFVRFLARDRGISTQELKQIKGSGANNRLTRDDINRYILEGRPFRTLDSVGEARAEVSGPQIILEGKEYEPGPGETVIPMDRTRKVIAEHMVRSKRTSPHVTSMVEVDLTRVVQWREANKQRFQEIHGVKLTYTPVIVEAVVHALKEFPGVNISVSGDKIIQKSYLNIGVATALPDGNLIVPVIKNADQRNFVNIALVLHELVGKARNNKLTPADIKGGTFTITNMGQYDNVSGTPIINQPEAAILAVGAIKKKPAVVKINNELTIGIRDIMVLSLTYDHRVVDGSLGGSFVRAIGKYLESRLPEF